MLMKRRGFIQVLGAFSLYNALPRIYSCLGSNTQRKLILIELKGGNDVLNTIVPFRNDIYYRNRPRIAVEQGKVLKLTDDHGLHPNLGYFREAYDSGELVMLNNVGYPNPSRSHFTSRDIWHSCVTDPQPQSGWIGRYLDDKFPTQDKTAHALELANVSSIAMKGDMVHTVAYENFANSALLYNNLDLTSEEIMSTSSTDFIRRILSSSNDVFNQLFTAYKRGAAKAEFPESVFGAKLETIARLISADSTPEVYFCVLPGFDTHAAQLKTHAMLMKSLNDGVKALVQSLKATGNFDDSLIIMYSEFGRRVAQNASQGTDHGKGGSIFVIGNNLAKPGLYNQPSDLTKLDEGDIPYEIDFRSVYGTILKNWKGNSDPAKILGSDYPLLDFI